MSVLSRTFGFVRKVLHEETDFSTFLAAGPISVFCTLIVALQRNGNLDLVVLAIVGTVLCMKGRMRGWVYSALLLAVSAMIKHVFFIESHHLWQWGIEGSMLIGFAMTAAALEMVHCKEKNLVAQVDNNEKTIRNLEEELDKTRQEALQEQISLRERLTVLQKDFDESQSEFSSFQILNDVLRKTTAQTNQEREEIAQKFHEKDRQTISLHDEIEKLRPQAALLRGKVAEREFELNRMQGQLHGWVEQLAGRDQAIQLLQEKTSERETAVNLLQGQMRASVEQLVERDQTIQVLQEKIAEHDQYIGSLREKNTEREALLNRLQAQEQGWVEQLAERDQTIHLLQERLQAAAHKEALYQELRKQFDEKNRVLHRTRVELFQTDTALQAMRLEQEQQKTGDTPDIERELSDELAALEQERQSVEQENEKLFELVTLLSNEASPQVLKRLSKNKQNSNQAEANSKNQPFKKIAKKKKELNPLRK